MVYYSDSKLISCGMVCCMPTLCNLRIWDGLKSIMYRIGLLYHLIVFMFWLLQNSFLASFLLGWGIIIGAGLASYPIDTVRRRMMMTSGEAVKYKSSLDAFKQIVKNEGSKSLFKGAGANILRAVAGAGVLAGYDKLQLIVFGKKYGSGGGG